MSESLLGGRVMLHCGDCREAIGGLPDDSIDAVVTDPPYALVSIVKRFGKPGSAPVNNANTRAGNGNRDPYANVSRGFMGKQWDTGETAFATGFWIEVLRVLKPGGHVVSFGGTRTYHRLVCALEDAGFEIRDQLAWVYGSGFPKSHDVSKGIDKHLGAEREQICVTNVRNPKATGGGRDGMEGATRPWIEAALERGYHEKDGDIPATDAARQWQGYGTALKPSWEPICLARKPLSEGTVAANVLAHGTGAINIDGCRIDAGARPHIERRNDKALDGDVYGSGINGSRSLGMFSEGRWPANLIHDGSDEVLAGFPETTSGTRNGVRKDHDEFGTFIDRGRDSGYFKQGDSGSAARFFYTAKADQRTRLGTRHPTVKPLNLMQWLVRLVTPKGGVVLDPLCRHPHAHAAGQGICQTRGGGQDQAAIARRRRHATVPVDGGSAAVNEHRVSFRNTGMSQKEGMSANFWNGVIVGLALEGVVVGLLYLLWRVAS